MYALGNLFLADDTNLSTKSSYCFPLTRGFRRPRYSSSLSKFSFCHRIRPSLVTSH